MIYYAAGSSLLLSSKTELFATVVEFFQLQIIVTKSSILDVGSDLDQPLITVFGKVIIHLAQETSIQFNLIAIYEGSCLYGNCKVLLYERI